MYVPTPTEYLAFSHYMSFIRLISLFTVDLLSWHWSFIAYLGPVIVLMFMYLMVPHSINTRNGEEMIVYLPIQL